MDCDEGDRGEGHQSERKLHMYASMGLGHNRYTAIQVLQSFDTVSHTCWQFGGYKHVQSRKFPEIHSGCSTGTNTCLMARDNMNSMCATAAGVIYTQEGNSTAGGYIHATGWHSMQQRTERTFCATESTITATSALTMRPTCTVDETNQDECLWRALCQDCHGIQGFKCLVLQSCVECI